MARRPPSSSGSARPFTATPSARPTTSGGARPGTSSGASPTGAAPGYYDTAGAGGYPYSVYEEDEEDESEPEDVFAYLPPTTADSFPQPAGETGVFAHGPPSTAGGPFAHHPDPVPPHGHAHPLQASMPQVGYHASPPDSAPPRTPADAHPMPPPPTLPAESPPSTTSAHSPQVTGTEEGGLRMRRLDPATHGTPVSSVRPPSSREVHISLPPTASEKGGPPRRPADLDLDLDQDLEGKKSHHHPASSAGDSVVSAGMTRSVVDDSDASIKCVSFLHCWVLVFGWLIGAAQDGV